MLRLGSEKQFTLDPGALAHIIDGEFTKRPETTPSGIRGAVDVLSGGLHTWDAWKIFLQRRPGFVHLADFDPVLHKGWYFGRELQNGVIALKIPKELFSGDGASITMQPDLHFKSGYLWKTLFPLHFTTADVVDVITEALENISADESQYSQNVSIIIGYARLTDPFKTIRIRVQLQGSEIRSAFPSWDQPSTGNNGKPYSPEQAILFAIAASTVGVTHQSVRNSQLFKRTGEFDVAALIHMTPEFLRGRTYPDYGVVSDEWRLARNAEVREFSVLCSIEEANKAATYLCDFCICKEPFFLQTMLWRNDLYGFLGALGLLNIAMIMQNVADCFTLLLHHDNNTGNRRFIESAVRFVAMSVIHTGFVNLLEYKRILKLILDGAIAHHGIESIKTIFEAISISPIRVALYSEVNVNAYNKSNDDIGFSVIGHDSMKVPITTGLIYDWGATNLGENYLVTFSKDQCLKIAKAFATQNANEKFLKMSLRYFTGSDFDFFCCNLEDLAKHIGTREKPSETSLIELLREYDRMLLTYRQRIVLEDIPSYEAEVDYEQAGTIEFFQLIKQKHKRQLVIANHTRAIDALCNIAVAWGYARLEKRVENIRGKMGKDRIPMPLSVPLHLQKWDKLKFGATKDIDAFVADPLSEKSKSG